MAPPRGIPPPYSQEANGAIDLSPLPSQLNRPKLPMQNRNPQLDALPEDVAIVKFQTIVRDDKEIIIGRIKVPTPDSHAFILRRYDTDAISLTTMFRAAFPKAAQEAEGREMDWVKSAYEIGVTNGTKDNNLVKLAGQWVKKELAVHLSEHYGILELVVALARSVPDPNVTYRKSQRSQIAAEDHRTTGTAARPAPAPEPTAMTPRANKRTRRSTAQSEAGESGNERMPEADEQDDIVAKELEKARNIVKDVTREARSALSAAASQVSGSTTRGTKRGRTAGDEIELPKGATKGAKAERVIKTNKRIAQAQPQGAGQKVAWGVLMFGLGLGVATMLPNVISQIPVNTLFNFL